MYTIKVNVFEYQDGNRIFVKSYLTEASEITVKDYEGENANAKSLIETYPSDCHIVNIGEKLTTHLVVLGFFGTKDEYKYLAVFNYAEIYILQNGKTIDKIIV